MTAQEMIALSSELADAVDAADGSFTAELDAMSAEEAWNKCCYGAWLDRRARLSQKAFEAALAPARARIKALLEREVQAWRLKNGKYPNADEMLQAVLKDAVLEAAAPEAATEPGK